MRKLENQEGVVADAGVYLKGKLVDGTTIVGEGINQDIVQFFQKLISLAGITANDTPDNEVNGYQAIDALIKVAGGNTYTKVFEIGSWNMDTNGTTAISIAPIGATKVRNINAVIIPDSGLTAITLDGSGLNGELGGRCVASGNSLICYRSVGGAFDNSDYSGSNNRGYVTIDYVL